MEYLTQLLSGEGGIQPENTWIVVLLLSGTVFILILVVMLLINEAFNPVRSRFKQEINTGSTSIKTSEGLLKKLRLYSNIFVPSDNPLLQRTTMRLHYAGFHLKNSLLYYYAIRMVLMIGIPLLVVGIMSLIPATKGISIVQSAMGSFVLGYMGVSFVLDKIIAKRQKIIRRAFPDALDMLVICSEAGLSLDSALQKVTTELSMSQPILADELSIVIAEIRAGIDRHLALQRLVEKTGVEDIKGLVSALSQCMRFGTSIAETLREYSEELRDKRTQAAEEMAAKIGVKLIFPLGLCLMPAFILVVMAPTFIALKSVNI